MPDIPNGFGSSSGGDRLSALRQNSQSQLGSITPRKIRIELLIGLAALVALVAVLIVLLGSRTSAVVSPTSTPSSQVQASNGLDTGEALIAIALEEGAFPPHVRTGDQVRIIVTPNSDGGGSTHGLEEITTVQSVNNSSDIGGRTVMTVIGPESVAVAVASSGPVHIAVVHEVGE